MELNPNKHAFKLLSEFKAFALKGNVIDLAVAVIIGTAFGAIVKSTVENVLMPLISYITPNMDFKDWQLGKVKIGLLLNDIINFVIVAFAVFLFVVKFLGWIIRMKKHEEAVPPALPEPTKEELLLTEIRDLLKAKQ